MIDRPWSRRLGLVAALALAAPPALAAAPDADAVSQRATELYKQANALYDEKKLPEAEALYLQAWALKKTYDVASNLGAIELDLGKQREAAEFFAFALREFPAGGKSAAREQLKTRFLLARAQVGARTVEVSPPGAEVLVDGKSTGAAPLLDDLFLAPGTHTIEARLAGYEKATVTLGVAKGSSDKVVLALRAAQGPPPVVTGPNKAILIGGGAVAGAAIVTGAVLVGVAAAKGSAVSSLEAQTRQAGGCSSTTAGGNCAALRSDLSFRQTVGSAGLWTLVGGGAVGIATLVYGLVPGTKTPPPAKTGWGLRPAVGPGGGGLIVDGTF
jgi:hypothetical protein